jgi:CRISPR-associated protein Cmr1
MPRISVNLETVTAAFLHVEPDGEARWRAAPFRGIARWWFRAIVGAAFPPEEVREQEAELFGTTEMPSKIIVRVLDFSQPSTSSQMSVNPGGGKHDALRYALLPGSKARLELIPAAHCSHPQEALDKVYACLWTALHLGGIGQRSRRGAGSLRTILQTGHDGLLRPATASDPFLYAKELSEGLHEVRRILNADRVRVKCSPEYPLLHPSCAQIRVVSGPWGGSEESVRAGIMTIRRNHHRQPYISNQGEHEFGAVRDGRLSSPLWVRVAEISDDHSLIVITLMKHKGADAKQAQWKYVEDFMNDGNWIENHLVHI